VPYQVEKLKKVVSAIAKEPETFYMEYWMQYPGDDSGVTIRELITKQGQYIPPPCGTTMCLGGHLAHERLKEMVEIGERINPKSSVSTLAMEYLGLPTTDPDWADYFDKFSYIFTRTNIRTVNGLRSALRRRGLL
jgi:hypothetical protein